MQGLYDAIGSIAAAAHANGDDIDENMFPESDPQDRHGVDVVHSGRYLLFRAVPNEPRFVVDCPFTFTGRFRSRYTPEEVAQRANVDLQTLSDEERAEVTERLLEEDLAAAASYDEQFWEAFKQRVEPTKVSVHRITRGPEEAWNGVLVRDRLFPYDDSFDIEAYRRTVERVTSVHHETVDLLYEQVPPLNGDADDGKARTADVETAHPAGFE